MVRFILTISMIHIHLFIQQTFIEASYVLFTILDAILNIKSQCLKIYNPDIEKEN